MKALIISHNPISSYENMGKTFASLFSAFDKDEICQLYIHQSIPDLDFCSSYYRITDKEVVKGLFVFPVKGSIVSPKKRLDEGNTSKPSQLKKRKKGYWRYLARDFLWKHSRWCSKNLKKWIDEQKPTCIFVAIGGARFLYDMAIRVSQMFNLPIVVYICDNYYSYEQKDFFGKLWLNQLRKKTDKLINCASYIVTISDLMKQYYEARFDIPCYTIMTGASLPLVKTPKKINQVKCFRFFGNTTIKRYKSLADICRVIDDINEEENDSITLEIYNKAISQEEIAEFNDIKCCSFKGFLLGSEYEKTFLSSDVLVHVESFDEQMIERVKYSLSTKLGDCLSSGIPLFIYGPESVASISQFVDWGHEFVCTDPRNLKALLKKIIYNQAAREQSVLKQLTIAKDFFSKENNSVYLRNILSLFCARDNEQ